MSWVKNRIKEELTEQPELETRYREEQTKIDTADALMDLRTDLGLTQREFGDRAGKSQSVIARIEAGKMQPSFKLVNEISSSLGKQVKNIIKANCKFNLATL